MQAPGTPSPTCLSASNGSSSVVRNSTLVSASVQSWTGHMLHIQNRYSLSIQHWVGAGAHVKALLLCYWQHRQYNVEPNIPSWTKTPFKGCGVFVYWQNLVQFKYNFAGESRIREPTDVISDVITCRRDLRRKACMGSEASKTPKKLSLWNLVNQEWAFLLQLPPLYLIWI